MKIQLSPLISDARGKLGNLVFSIAKSQQHYVRIKAAIRANPRSADQQFIRSAISFFHHEWVFSLSVQERADWETYAQRTQRVAKDMDQGGGKNNLIPRSKPYSGGWQAYIGTNIRIAVCEGDTDGMVPAPPPGERPWMVDDLAIVWNVTDDDIDLTWTDPGYVDLTDTAYLRVWLQSYAAGAHKQLVTCVVTSAALLTVTNVKYALGIESDINVHPGLYRLQCDVIMLGGSTETGLISAPSRIFDVIALL